MHKTCMVSMHVLFSDRDASCIMSLSNLSHGALHPEIDLACTDDVHADLHGSQIWSHSPGQRCGRFLDELECPARVPCCRSGKSIQSIFNALCPPFLTLSAANVDNAPDMNNRRSDVNILGIVTQLASPNDQFPLIAYYFRCSLPLGLLIY